MAIWKDPETAGDESRGHRLGAKGVRTHGLPLAAIFIIIIIIIIEVVVFLFLQLTQAPLVNLLSLSVFLLFMLIPSLALSCVIC